ncbi:FAD-dependent monooxygenase [Streptomyces sp. NBC_01622]|uniref:FAD-dependent monooxygenase n=1 Tax=Streptomyces sp. NBC_01622 TaxID=2975903 RepID=UPI003866F1A8|nr:FAD-dependent monooxygenase [Streptomyces sp. NBC_01622]
MTPAKESGAVSSADHDVVVVGGGIGGLGSALALARAGQRVRVLEQAPAFGEVGAGLQMAPNATRILREWGLLDEVVDRGVLPRRLVLRDAVDGKELTHLDLAWAARQYGAPYVVIHRSDLHAILVDACRAAEVELVTDAHVDDVEVTDIGATAVQGAHRHPAALVLAADGLQSGLRARLSADTPVNSAYVAYRGAFPMSAVGDLDGLSADDVVVYVGPGCHLVQYPLRGGAMLNQVAVFRSPTALAGAPEWGGPDELDEAFAGMCAQVRSALTALWRDRKWPMFDRLPISRWVEGRLALTGDAAHPMLQYLAQGACQALEDAHCLATLATKQSAASTDHEPLEWDTILRTYNEARASRTAQVQERARFWGELWHCDGMARTLRNTMLRDRDPADRRHLDWLYAP